MTQIIEFISNHYLLSAAWGVIFILLVNSIVSGLFSKIKTISSHDLTMLVNRSEGKVIDMRTKSDFEKGHIAGSIHLTMDKMKANKYGSLENDKSVPMILVCNAGISAKTAAKLMLDSGFEEVSVLSGGMQSWLSKNLPVVK